MEDPDIRLGGNLVCFHLQMLRILVWCIMDSLLKLTVQEEHGPGAACTTNRTTRCTSGPGRNLAVSRANEIVGVYDDNVVRFVGANAGQPSEVDLAESLVVICFKQIIYLEVSFKV